MTQVQWQFDENRTGERDGFHDTGVSHFTGNRLDSLVREVIQNSLDARQDPTRPVIVRFNRDRVKGNLIDSTNLVRSILDSVVSPDNDDRDKIAFKETALTLLKGTNQSVHSLKIEDANTTGASDTGSEPTMWEALTKGSGLNVKRASDAGGSFGVGKFAAFAASDVRTVLYSTAWREQAGSELHHRFIGRTILVSRTDRKTTQKLRGIGYLASDGFHAAKDHQVPDRFKNESPGTTLWILRRLDDTWDDRVCQSVVAHFYHAIIHRGLDATVNRVQIAERNIDQFIPADSRGATLRKFIFVSRQDPVETTRIQGIGIVNLRLEVYRNDRSNKDRNVALVRDAGMMITNERKDMGIQIGRLNSNWYGFTAVLECLSEGGVSLLRDCESPQHNKVSVDEISDEKRRGDAERRLRELGGWVKRALRKHVESDISGESENASELAQFLPLVPETDEEYEADGNNNGAIVAISSIRQQDRPPPSSRRRARRLRGGTSSSPGDQGNEGSGGRGRGGGGRSNGRGGTRRDTNAAFGNIRFLESDHPHELTVSFDSPGEKLKGVGLVVVGEDGQERAIKISRVTNGKGEPIGVDRKSGSTRAISSDEDKIILKMRLLEPVANKTFNLTENPN